MLLLEGDVALVELLALLLLCDFDLFVFVFLLLPLSTGTKLENSNGMLVNEPCPLVLPVALLEPGKHLKDPGGDLLNFKLG